MAIESAEELLTVNEVAERLKVHPITVRRHIKAGRLRALRAGRSIRVRASDLEAFLRPAEPLVADRPPPTPEELARRKKLIEETLARRDRLPPLGISTAELVRQARRDLEDRYERA